MSSLRAFLVGNFLSFAPQHGRARSRSHLQDVLSSLVLRRHGQDRFRPAE
jgi:hypothetical protein